MVLDIRSEQGRLIAIIEEMLNTHGKYIFARQLTNNGTQRVI